MWEIYSFYILARRIEASMPKFRYMPVSVHNVNVCWDEYIVHAKAQQNYMLIDINYIFFLKYRITRLKLCDLQLFLFLIVASVSTCGRSVQLVYGGISSKIHGYRTLHDCFTFSLYSLIYIDSYKSEKKH